jgi:hypothetical protein
VERIWGVRGLKALEVRGVLRGQSGFVLPPYLECFPRTIISPSAHCVMQVLDYVSQKAAMYDVERQHNAWARKVEIAEMEARRYQQLTRKLGDLGS